MARLLRHVAVIPARNEALHLGRTLESLLAQTEPPSRIIVVDDGSTDNTLAVANLVAAQTPTVTVTGAPPTADGWWGPRVVAAFSKGVSECSSDSVEYVSKFDADIDLPHDYCERLLALMDRHPDIGIAGGGLLEMGSRGPRRYRLAADYVPGSNRTYRKTLLDAMGGIPPVSAWELADHAKARSLGFRTLRLPELEVVHRRPQGSAVSVLRSRMHWGRGAYIVGSLPLYVLGRGLYRMIEVPFVLGGLAFWCGYLGAMIRRIPQVADQAIIRSIRKQQRESLGRLLGWHRASSSTVAAARVPIDGNQHDDESHAGSLDRL